MSLLEVSSLSVNFNLPTPLFQEKRILHAVKSVSFAVESGETLAIVGESGSGKSTLVRAILRLVTASEGDVVFDGENLMNLNQGEMRARRKRLGMIFQDPIASLSPRRTVFQIIEEPLLVHFPQLTADEREAKVGQFMDLMRLPFSVRNRYPHEFSGGQAQRIGIARALICEPDLLIADEPVSALDVSIQAEVLDLLSEIKESQNLTMLFISHDLSVVYQVADRVLVLQHGEIKETGTVANIFGTPKDPYTQRLLAAIPTL